MAVVVVGVIIAMESVEDIVYRTMRTFGMREREASLALPLNIYPSQRHTRPAKIDINSFGLFGENTKKAMTEGIFPVQLSWRMLCCSDFAYRTDRPQTRF